MIARPAPALLPVCAARPPYQLWTPWLPPAPAPDGTVLAVTVREPALEGVLLPATVARVRAATLTAPLVLRVEGEAGAAGWLAAAAEQLQLRGVVLPGPAPADALRRALTEPADLAGSVVAWLVLYGVRLSPVTRYLLLNIVEHADRFDTLSGLRHHIGESDRSARARFAKKGLPPPGRWLAAARALRTALRLQAEPRCSAHALAARLGYAEPSVVHHQLQRAFGVRTSQVRGTLGWEWLLARWLRRAGQEAWRA